MKIVVCVKQVASPESVIVLDSRAGKLSEQEVDFILNPYDEYAVEEAIRIKERLTGEVVVISLGDLQAEKSLRTCLAMGADEGIMITDDILGSLSARAVAYVLASAIRKIGFDLVMCGVRSIDDENSQFCPSVGELLSIPNICGVRRLDVHGDKITAWRQLEGGSEKVELSLPCVLSAERGLNEPRIPTLPSIIQVKKKAIKRLSLRDIGLSEDEIHFRNSKLRVIGYTLPKPRRSKELENQRELSADERIKLIMSGGLTQKASENILRGEEDDVILKVVNSIRKALG